VDRLKVIPLDCRIAIEAEHPTTDDALFAITHAAIEEITEAQQVFRDHDSEIETAAREALGTEFEAIVRACGFANVDIEEVIAPRDW
jgi:hypothetical protein